MVPDRASSLDVCRQQLLGLVAEHYPELARSLLRPLLDLLSLSREACGGDADKFLIMVVVAIRTTEHPSFARYSQAELLSGALPVFPSLGTNVGSVAESLGVPKETVRRKVNELIKTGWIVRECGELKFTALAYQHLAGVRIVIERLAVLNFEVVANLIRQHTSAA